MNQVSLLFKLYNSGYTANSTDDADCQHLFTADCSANWFAVNSNSIWMVIELKITKIYQDSTNNIETFTQGGHF